MNNVKIESGNKVATKWQQSGNKVATKWQQSGNKVATRSKNEGFRKFKFLNPPPFGLIYESGKAII